MVYFIKTGDCISILDGGKKSFNIPSTHPNYQKVCELVLDPSATFESIEPLVNIAKTFESKDQNVEVKYDESTRELDLTIKYPEGDRKVGNLPAQIIDRIVKVLKSEDVEFDFAIFSKFLYNLYQNPSYKSISQLLRFIENNDLPMTPNGTFLAYKKIANNYTDLRTGKFDNSVGQTVKMYRNEVEDNPDVTCSHGLHVCSQSYLNSYGGTRDSGDRVVIVEINPKDVVSVPYDYNNAKMRVCEYKVIDEIKDFRDQHLSSYVSGTHADGWVAKMIDKIENFYMTFFKLPTIKWDRIEDVKTSEITEVVRESFINDLIDTFQDEVSLPAEEDLVKVMTPSNILSPSWMLSYLSKYDSKFIFQKDLKD